MTSVYSWSVICFCVLFRRFQPNTFLQGVQKWSPFFEASYLHILLSGIVKLTIFLDRRELGNYFITKLYPKYTSLALAPWTESTDHIIAYTCTTILFQYCAVGTRCCMTVVFAFFFHFFTDYDTILLHKGLRH